MRKKLFAILMSAMMMVTFMPAMAFAGVTRTTDSGVQVAFNDDYSQVTATYKGATYTFNTEKNANLRTGSNVWTGLIEAKAVQAELDADTELITAVKTAVGNSTAYFYDVTGAKMAYGATGTALPEKFGKTNFKKIFNGNDGYAYTGLILTLPTTVKNYKTAATTTAFLEKTARVLPASNSGMINWNTSVLLPATYDDVTLAEQSFDVAVQFAPVHEVDASGNYPDVIGTVVQKLTQNKQVEDAAIYVDSKKDANKVSGNITKAYDGAEHRIVFEANDKTGATVAFQVYNYAKGKYEAATDVTFKNVTKSGYPIKFKGTITYADKSTEQIAEKTITVTPQNPTKLGFITNDAPFATENGTKTFKVVEGYDAWDYVAYGAVTATGDAGKALTAAMKADMAELVAFAKETFKITQTAAKFDATKVTAKLAKDTEKFTKMTAAEKKAYDAKYKQLAANYGYANADLLATGIEGTEKTAYFVVKDDRVNDIEWTKAPLTKKYHNKKGTLKKTYTFAVEAKADSKVTYKLQNGGSMIKIDKNTGKVTVKKGLKVGTYKVYVTAKAGSSEDTYTLTIKMAKK